MSKGQTLRALVNERLTAAAEEIFALFERTIAEYEEQLCCFKEENQRKRHLQDSVNQITETPQIKEEPEEQYVKQEDEVQWQVSDPDIWVKPEESSVLPQGQTVHREETQGDETRVEDIRTHPETQVHTDSDENWGSKFRWTGAPVEMEADGDHCNQTQIKDGSTAVQNSDVSSDNVTTPGTSATVNEEDMSETDADADKKKHRCSVCKKTYKYKQNLQIHLRVHTGERPFRCRICEKTFAQNSNLYVHMRIHSGDRPYSCSTCNKTFVHKWNLDAHVRLHTGERPFICSICNKTFTQKGALDGHMRIHTGERPYSCSLCERAFSQKNNLDGHMRLHMAWAPYTCSLCNKTFAQKPTLDAHMQVHAGDLQLFNLQQNLCEKLESQSTYENT